MANLKKILCLMLALIVMLATTLAFVACDDNPEESSTESSSVEESTTESSSEQPTESESTETESGLREVENGNTELGPGWTVPIPPDYSKQ